MLNSGNWFELKSFNKEKSQPYDLFSLQKEIFEQINSREKNLEFINITFGKRYTRTELTDIEFHLTENQLKNFSNKMQSEKMHPIITFHGTSDPKTVESIFKSGYLIPGTGSVKKAHGSAYGNGIYSSPHFDKAIYYTKPDEIKTVYVLVNLVFLGRMKLIPPGGLGIDHVEPINGAYSDGTNTRIVYGLEQLVCADSSRIVPVGVMKIKVG